jgi:methylamine dehydrogenase accessory protein MauD
VIDALVISNVLLWVLVLALAAVVFALVRQLGVLHERVAPAGALAQAAGPRVGGPAPELELRDWAGRSVRVGGAGPDGAGTFLLFVSPTCPLCKTLLPVVERVARAEGRRLRVILASDGPRAEHEAFVREHGLDARTYVLSTPLGLAFQVAKLPHAVLLDAQGIVRAQGLVNTREHLESLFEAEARGVASIQEYLARTGTESA